MGSRAAEPTQAGLAQDAAHGGFGEPGLDRNGQDGQAPAAQDTDLATQALIGPARLAPGPAGGVLEGRAAALLVALEPLGSSSRTHPETSSCRGRAQTPLQDGKHHLESTSRRELGISVDVHSWVVGWIGSSHTHPWPSAPNEQPIETSHLGRNSHRSEKIRALPAVPS